MATTLSSSVQFRSYSPSHFAFLELRARVGAREHPEGEHCGRPRPSIRRTTALSKLGKERLVPVLTLEEPRHDLFAELAGVTDAERLPGAGPSDHLGIFRLEDPKQIEGERLHAAALAEALPLLLLCCLLRTRSRPR